MSLIRRNPDLAAAMLLALVTACFSDISLFSLRESINFPLLALLFSLTRAALCALMVCRCVIWRGNMARRCLCIRRLPCWRRWLRTSVAWLGARR